MCVFILVFQIFFIYLHKTLIFINILNHSLMNKKDYLKQYIKTPRGRANNLLCGYRASDEKYNRGECTLTADWIVENIFSGQKCVYCGESDWKKLGCDRIDDSLPHTPENCQPCCWKCNNQKSRPNTTKALKGIPNLKLSKTVLQYDKEGNFIKEWSSAIECGRNGFDNSNVAKCCRGKLKTHKGYIWKYK